MAEPTKAELEQEVKALQQRVKELETANGTLQAENDGLRSEGQDILAELEDLKAQLKEPGTAAFSDEHKFLIQDLAATYVRLKSDGRIDTRERDELDAKLDAALQQLQGIVG